MSKQLTYTITVTGPITLEDLRWLVEQTSQYDSASRVTVKEDREYNSMERTTEQITVTSTVKG